MREHQSVHTSCMTHERAAGGRYGRGKRGPSAATGETPRTAQTRPVGDGGDTHRRPRPPRMRPGPPRAQPGPAGADTRPRGGSSWVDGLSAAAPSRGPGDSGREVGRVRDRPPDRPSAPTDHRGAGHELHTVAAAHQAHGRALDVVQLAAGVVQLVDVAAGMGRGDSPRASLPAALLGNRSTRGTRDVPGAPGAVAAPPGRVGRLRRRGHPRRPRRRHGARVDARRTAPPRLTQHPAGARPQGAPRPPTEPPGAHDH